MQPVHGTSVIPLAGPAFAGDRLAWAERVGTKAIRFLTAAPGRAPRVVDVWNAPTASPYSPAPEIDTRLSASATRLVIERRVVSPEFQFSVVAGPLKGPFRPVALCGEHPMRGIDVSGEAAIGREAPGCHGAAVLDLATGQRTSLPGAERSARIAGRYAAWFTDPVLQDSEYRADVVVWDWVANEELYRLPAMAFPSRLRSLSVQADGKVAVVYEDTPRNGHQIAERVGWASPPEPYLHELPLPVGDGSYYAVRLVGDQIVYLSGRPFYPENAVQAATIGLIDLAGQSRTLGYPAYGRIDADNFDFDGERVAWVRVGCRGAVIVDQSLADPPQIGKPRSGCRLQLARPLAVTGDDLLLGIACRGFSDQCSLANYSVVAESGRARVRLAHGIQQLNRRRVTVRLSMSLLRKLARHRRWTARVRVKIVDPFVGQETRTGVVRLSGI
ncbi:MAG: hypothetical protein ACJ76Z_00600 [Thermoleophilaceae bacterium]